jgi:hypothetical protein
VEFINRYFEHLQYKRAYTNSSVIFSGGRTGLRLDRVLVCEVLQNSEHLNKCLRASYAYKLLGSKREHAADFKIRHCARELPALGLDSQRRLGPKNSKRPTG